MENKSIFIDVLGEIPYKNEGISISVDVSVVWKLSGLSIYDFFCNENITNLLKDAYEDYESSISDFTANTALWVKPIIAYELIKQISSSAAIKFFEKIPDIYTEIICDNNAENLLKLSTLQLLTAQKYYFQTLTALYKNEKNKDSQFVFQNDDDFTEKRNKIKEIIGDIAWRSDKTEGDIWTDIYHKYTIKMNFAKSVYNRKKEAKFEGTNLDFLYSNGEFPRFFSFLNEEYDNFFTNEEETNDNTFFINKNDLDDIMKENNLTPPPPDEIVPF